MPGEHESEPEGAVADSISAMRRLKHSCCSFLSGVRNQDEDVKMMKMAVQL